jgi:hypothetical protein
LITYNDSGSPSIWWSISHSLLLEYFSFPVLCFSLFSMGNRIKSVGAKPNKWSGWGTNWIWCLVKNSLWRVLREMMLCLHASLMNLTSIFQAVSIKFHLLDVLELLSRTSDRHYKFCCECRWLFYQCMLMMDGWDLVHLWWTFLSFQAEWTAQMFYHVRVFFLYKSRFKHFAGFHVCPCKFHAELDAQIFHNSVYFTLQQFLWTYVHKTVFTSQWAQSNGLRWGEIQNGLFDLFPQNFEIRCHVYCYIVTTEKT